MPAVEILGFVNLFLAGILAGEELVICYGVRGPVGTLDEQSQIRLRQALIRRLRVPVPIAFMSTLLSGLAVTILAGFDVGFVVRSLAIVVLIIWFSVTLLGTVPINKATLDWDPDAPPGNWRAVVRRWERLDVVRCWAALSAFALLLIAMALVQARLL